MFLQPGVNQLAAGYVLYGPQTTLVLTVGKGASIFTLDRRVGDFVMTQDVVAIPPNTAEFAVNASNRRYWSAGISRYVEDCLAGRDGPRGQNTNMRWVASLVAECQRILVRGGIFLYPDDAGPAMKTVAYASCMRRSLSAGSSNRVAAQPLQCMDAFLT